MKTKRPASNGLVTSRSQDLIVNTEHR